MARFDGVRIAIDLPEEFSCAGIQLPGAESDDDEVYDGCLEEIAKLYKDAATKLGIDLLLTADASAADNHMRGQDLELRDEAYDELIRATSGWREIADRWANI